jgi:hypothetical protein
MIIVDSDVFIEILDKKSDKGERCTEENSGEW